MNYTGTKANCQSLNVLQNKLQGYPIAGVHVGGGIHVDMPKTWDGIGKVPPGWTAYSDESMTVVPASVNWTTPVDSKTQDADATKTLTAADQTTLATVLAAGTITATAEIITG